MKSFYINVREIKKKKFLRREDKEMATLLLFSDAVTNIYKKTSKEIGEVDIYDKRVVKKTLTQIMKQSFFHGANRFGTNFIA